VSEPRSQRSRAVTPWIGETAESDPQGWGETPVERPVVSRPNIGDSCMVIKGVHRYKPTEDEFRHTLEIQWGRDLSWWRQKLAGRKVRKHFNQLYLVEVFFESGLPRPFDWGMITQNVPNVHPSNRQVPWDEQQVGADPKEWAFVFHCLDLSLPLSTPMGDLELPNPSPMPNQLMRIRYEVPG